MPTVFSQLYKKLLLGSAVILVGSLLMIQALALLQFRQYVAQHTQLLHSLFSSIDAVAEPEQRAPFIELLTQLSATQWQYVEQPTTSLDFLAKAARLSVPFGSGFLEANIRDWATFQSAQGWLILNDLSLVDSTTRQSRLDQLNKESAWPIARIPRDTVNFTGFELQQFASGNYVRKTEASTGLDRLYYPAGASQLIRLGPIPPYHFLPVWQWVTLAVAFASCFALWLYNTISPVHRRIQEIQRAVDDISQNPEHVSMPEHDDDLGVMSQHIAQMARTLIQEIERNRALNIAVSHDLKTPLARIKFALALLDNPDQEAALRISAEVDLLSNLVSELLSYHRLLGQATEHTEPLELVTPLRQWHQQLPMHHQQRMTINTSAALIQGDIRAEHWQRLYTNLIENALQYSEGHIWVELETKGQSWQFKVIDEGLGLTPEQLEQLKRPFARADKHRNLDQQRHGLGLALVDALVKHYGGTWYSTSKTHENSAIVVQIPTLT